MSMSHKPLYQKFIRGDALSDEELNQLIYLHESIAFGLNELGPAFHLAWKEVNANLEILNWFEDNRSEHKKGLIHLNRELST